MATFNKVVNSQTRNKMRIKNKTRVEHILEAIVEIRSFVQKISSPEEFEQDAMLKNACEWLLIIIGLASSKITPHTRAKHPEVDWEKHIELSRFLRENYFEVDIKEIWSVIENDLPILQPKIEAILKELE